MTIMLLNGILVLNLICRIIHVSGSSSHPPCKCTCADGYHSPQCSRCVDSVDYTCPPDANSCWERVIHDSCGIAKVTSDGVFMTRNDCCSPWQSHPFDSMPDPFDFYGTTYFKDFKTRQLVQYTPQLPPQYDFPGISALALSNWTFPYDNTTCTARCCRKATVTTTECGLDWRPCATLHTADSLPPCSGESTGQCATWVPCDINDRKSLFADLGSLLTLSGIYVIFLSYILIWKDSVNKFTRFKAYRSWYGILFTVFMVMSSFALVSVSDYEQWASQTEVDMKFISYQSCVAFCNNYQDDTGVIENKLCADPPNPQYALFPEDFNQHYNNATGCASGDAVGLYDPVYYCRSCQAHVDDWQSLDQAIRFIKVKTYILWSLLLVFASIDLLGSYIQEGNPISLYLEYVLYIECILFFPAFVACFICDCYFTNKTIGLFGVYQYTSTYPGRGQNIQVPASAICASFIPYDIIFVFSLPTLMEPMLVYQSKYPVPTFTQVIELLTRECFGQVNVKNNASSVTAVRIDSIKVKSEDDEEEVPRRLRGKP